MLNTIENYLFGKFQKNVSNPNFFILIAVIIFLKLRYNNCLLKQPKQIKINTNLN